MLPTSFKSGLRLHRHAQPVLGGAKVPSLQSFIVASSKPFLKRTLFCLPYNNKCLGRQRVLLLSSKFFPVPTTVCAGGSLERLHFAPHRSYVSVHEIYSKDLYKILNVSQTASGNEIKTAFYKAAKLYHPDLNKSDPNAQKKFVDATHAYEILMDNEKRKEYDMMRRTGGTTSYSYGESPTGTSYSYGTSRGKYQRSHMEDPLEEFMRWYQARGDIFDDFDRMHQTGQRWRQQSTGQEKSRTSSSQHFYWEEIHTGPFGTVYRTSRSSSGPSSSYQQAGSGGNNNSFFTFPFGGNLFGTLMGAFSKAMEEAFTSYAHASRSSTQQQRYRQESLSSVPLIHFPRMFKAEEASPFLGALMGAESERALAWEVTSADGEYLGRVDQSKDESKQDDLRYCHPDGLLMVKAKRTWNLDSSRTVDADDVERHFDKLGHGQVITLTNARNNSLQGKIVEYAQFSYNNPLTKWLNGIYSSFIVFNAKNEQEVLLRKWSLGNWGCYVHGLNDKKERIVNFKLPFRPLPWKLTWHFTRAFGEDEIVEEEWKREMRKEKKPSVHPVFYLTLAAFHSLDSKKRSLSHWLATKFGKAK